MEGKVSIFAIRSSSGDGIEDLMSLLVSTSRVLFFSSIIIPLQTDFSTRQT